ncbi:SRPBCC family protein [Natronomonas marina]|jgi:ligand-binding SRPBCC domain-containing protein|uniref:SRPBCC family protein n=1 Tax=Natronomonas marina TaxID=2961939 RepID=UPI0020C9E7CB|nr:SRPBCC family protein [Natronomonas marina]
MATYTRETRVEAPLEEVWAFHSTVDGLEALTPDFMNLEVRAVTGPDGDPDPEVLAAGSRIDLSMRPFGVGPRTEWTSVITERSEEEGAAMFHDVMEGGPFPVWEHTHRFFADGEATVVSDRVEYELPGGALGRAVSPLGWVGFEPMFRGRHRKTRELLE